MPIVGMTFKGLVMTARDAAGRDTRAHWNVSDPMPLGFDEPPALRVTVLPTGAVLFAPAFATGFRKDQDSVAMSNGSVRSTRMVNVSMLATVLFAGTGAKCN